MNYLFCICRPTFDLKPSLCRQVFHLSRSRIFFTALCTTFVYETWLGFRSCVLSHVTKRNLKTKLQIYTEPQPCFIHFVVGWAVSVDRHIIKSRCRQSNLCRPTSLCKLSSPGQTETVQRKPNVVNIRNFIYSNCPRAENFSTANKFSAELLKFFLVSSFSKYPLSNPKKKSRFAPFQFVLGSKCCQRE